MGSENVSPETHVETYRDMIVLDTHTEICDRFEALAADLVARGPRVDDVGKIVGGGVVRFLSEVQA